MTQGYGKLLNDFQDFYTRRLYNRIQDCFNRPISSAPGAWIQVTHTAHLYHTETHNHANTPAHTRATTQTHTCTHTRNHAVTRRRGGGGGGSGSG